MEEKANESAAITEPQAAPPKGEEKKGIRQPHDSKSKLCQREVLDSCARSDAGLLEEYAEFI